MFLKRLELQGFKSFARHTTLEFNGDVTAIVGPNGCGKSNLADALRWVLGEQRSSLLRARNLDEVIFGGSSQRSPLGMAEVTITLDNTQGWLPVDYSEVAISRRAYRSGESEYFINGQRVRLRQLADLLRRVRMGPNTYTIMGQGLVDAVLSLRPEERRAIVDEAADIGRLRFKLLDAEQKLEATQRDLERVRDIVTEIIPRLRQLQRQAERAQEQAQLAEELTQWQRAWYRHRRWEAEANLIAAGEARHQRHVAHQELTKRIGEVDEHLKDLNRRRRLIEERATERHQRTEELHRQEQQLAQAIAVDSERLSLYTRQREELMAEELQLDSQHQELSTEMGRLQSRRQELDQKAQEKATLFDTLTHEAQRQEERHRTTQNRLAEVRHQTLAQANRLAHLNTRQEHLEGRLQEMHREVEVTQDRIEQLERESGHLVTQRQTLGQEEADLTGQIHTTEKERQEQEKRQQQARAALEATRDELRRVEQQSERHRARLEILDQLRHSGAGLESGTRAILQASQASEPETPKREGASLPGVVGTLASLIQVPPGLESAIEAALEGYLQAVVVERWAEAEAAIEFLKQTGAGRANLIVMEGLRPTRPVQLLAERRVVGVASKLVRCSSRYQGVVDSFLGRTIVTEDLATAQRMVSRGLGQAVTLSGELLRPGGIISGGSPSGGVEIITWERELAQLPQQLDEVTQQRDALQAQQTTLQEGLRASEEVLSLLVTQERALRNDIEEKRGQLARLQGEEERLRWELGQLQERRGRLEKERAATQEELQKLADEGDKALTAETDEEQSLATLEEEERQVREAVRQAGAKVEETRAELRLGEQERDQSQVLWSHHETALGHLQAQIRQRRGRAKQLEEENTRLATTLASARREHSLVRRRLEEVSQRVAPLADELASLAEEESKLQQELRHLSSELASAEGLLAQALAEERRVLEEQARLAAEIEANGISLPPEEESPGTELSREEASRLAATVQVRLQDTQARLRRLGPINQEAIADYQATQERHDFLTTQVNDLDGGRANLEQAIVELNEQMAHQFEATFKQTNQEFARYFKLFFGGGNARLALTQPNHILDSGIEIMAQPPGKRLQSLAQLSGGERSLTATALLFALLETSPTPFCLLDEVDAALDDSNTTRFAEALRQLAQRTQFIVITHNRGTIEIADTIYGISMSGDNVSQVLSLRLSEVSLAS